MVELDIAHILTYISGSSNRIFSLLGTCVIDIYLQRNLLWLFESVDWRYLALFCQSIKNTFLWVWIQCLSPLLVPLNLSLDTTHFDVYSGVLVASTVAGFMDVVNSVTHLYDGEFSKSSLETFSVYMIMEFGWVVFVTPSEMISSWWFFHVITGAQFPRKETLHRSKTCELPSVLPPQSHVGSDAAIYEYHEIYQIVNYWPAQAINQHGFYAFLQYVYLE